MAVARENVDMFAKAGFSFEEFGDNTIKLMSVPGMLEDLNTKQLFLDILDEIDRLSKKCKVIVITAYEVLGDDNNKKDLHSCVLP